MNPHQVTKDFEAALCEYTGAPYAVAVNSCTMALLLAVAWYRKLHKAIGSYCLPDAEPYFGRMVIEIPKRTYVGVAQSIIHAGVGLTFRDEEWRGIYQLKPLPVWDCARWFTMGMYKPVNGFTTRYLVRTGEMLCVSFHHAKTLGDTQGGAILHDDAHADAWFRRARFDGRAEGMAPKDDTFQIGWHCYLSPDVAARLLWKLSVLPKHNDPLPNSDYGDLSLQECFK